ncbi:MAG TPA: ATP synthase F1 subunit gamma [Candidatus Baltobacteraceae bacterium]|jgi:F-type H+-transporting ATPase subunit gamma|nr:ATP synthase F1 subunit gamma [Candidatus Baltobacteraceae bacterium]
MPSVKDLRERIRSLKNTQQITKAMKQVAAAKIRRAELAQKQARPYADTLSEMLRDLMASVSSVDHPFMKPGNSGAPMGIILMTADKGLAGAFNSNITRAAELYVRENPSVTYYTVGIKARNFVRRTGIADHTTWALNAQPKIDAAREVANRVTDDFVAGKISGITLISSKLISMMSQRPETRKLVPVERTDIVSANEPQAPRSSVEFAPSPEFVLSRLLPKYLEFTIFSAMLETDAAFFAAQLLAMNNATDNAGKLIDELTIAMNNARQAAITKELLEIVGGAEALVNG